MSRHPRKNPSEALVPRVRTALEQRCGILPGQRLLVGVSGGSDSIALLHLLLELIPSLKIRIEIGHFDHRLREGSTADRDFVEKFGSSHGIPTHIGEWAQPLPGEDAARQARFEFLLQTSEEHHCDAIALGHQLEDRIETLLLRLGRGSGMRGLSGLRWRRADRVDIIRPLLGCTRDELEGWLAARGIGWQEDPTNKQMLYARNRLRLKVMPTLDELGPGWKQHARDSLEDLGDAWDWMQAECAGVSQRICSGDTIDRVAITALPDLLMRTILQSWLEGQGLSDLRREHLEDAAQLLRNGQTGQRCPLPHDAFLVLDPKSASLLPGESVETSSWTVSLSPVETVEGPTPRSQRPVTRLPGTERALVASRKVVSPLEVRRPEEGERVQLAGRENLRRVFRVLQEIGVPARLRPIWPVVTDAAGIIWIPGVGIAAHVAAESPDQGLDELLLRPDDEPGRLPKYPERRNLE